MKCEYTESKKKREIELPERAVSPYHRQLRWAKKTKRTMKQLRIRTYMEGKNYRVINLDNLLCVS